MADKPHTPETLATKWRCSARHVRNLIHRGELECFRIGKLMRIRVEAVEEYECRKSTPSDTIAESSLSSTSTPTESATATRLAPPTRARLSFLRQRCTRN